MAAQKDVQDLLRMLTTGRNKMPMMAAMTRVKSLQQAGFRSRGEIASGDLAVLSTTLGDEKAAKQLKAAAKKESGPDESKKRGASDSLVSSHDSKRKRSAYELADEPQTEEVQEARLTLPESHDEEEIAKTIVFCNRAPLVLAFAVTLLKYTMPEQPLSSRLSLAQAVVSLNSQSKAASIGITSGATAEKEGWGHGQPKVRIMSREVPVLKRGGYQFQILEKQEAGEDQSAGIKVEINDLAQGVIGSADKSTIVAEQQQAGDDTPVWAVSESISSKGSTFVARCTAVKSSVRARQLLKQLMADNPDLRDASHNITAWRVQSDKGGIIEECEDDGENGGGRHVLSILKADSLVGVMIVLTRWYGGIMLGSQRWVLMTQVCRDSLSQRLRVPGAVGKEALWGLDLEAMRSTNAPVVGGTAAGMPVHRPESARAYILKAFASEESSTDGKKKKSGVVLEREKENNVRLLLGALDLLFGSWAQHISRRDLDRRAWIWYTEVRPEVEPGRSGWGVKGPVRLAQILSLRRKG